jgi:hypothetical protein
MMCDLDQGCVNMMCDLHPGTQWPDLIRVLSSHCYQHKTMQRSPLLPCCSPSVPAALDKAGIKERVAWYTQAAKNAIAAGFDGVEIHGRALWILFCRGCSKCNHCWVHRLRFSGGFSDALE